MVEKTFHIPKVGKITLVKNKRSKHFKLRVKPDKQVFVSLPYYSSYENALKFAREHTNWILKQQNKFGHGLTKFKINSTYDTKKHTIKIVGSVHEKPYYSKSNNFFTVFSPSENGAVTSDGQDYISTLITEIYRKEAKEYLPQKLAQLAGKHGFSYQKVTIRNNKTNWGSCSSKNTISLNLHLMKLPFHLIDYILLHELVHTKIKNHSPAFHKMLDTITGGQSKKLAKELKHFSTYTY